MEQQAEYQTVSDRSGFGHWAIVELMGHVKLAGYVTEEELFGSKIGRIDIPGPDGKTVATQYFGGGSVYRLTPVSEHVAKMFAVNHQPKPVTTWELKTLELPAGDIDGEYEPEYDAFDDDYLD